MNPLSETRPGFDIHKPGIETSGPASSLEASLSIALQLLVSIKHERKRQIGGHPNQFAITYFVISFHDTDRTER